jgi:hypothetical protein
MREYYSQGEPPLNEPRIVYVRKAGWESFGFERREKVNVMASSVAPNFGSTTFRAVTLNPSSLSLPPILVY